jgi:hypothetical protein
MKKTTSSFNTIKPGKARERRKQKETRIERNQGIYKPMFEVGKFELLEEIHGR